VRDFVEESARVLGIDIVWKGMGVDEVGVDKKTGKTIIAIDPQFYRPAEVHILLGDPTKAKNKLGWEPKVKFKELVQIMTEADMEILNNSIESKSVG
jgi:GDPmannose 4,6-dehydratase